MQLARGMFLMLVLLGFPVKSMLFTYQTEFDLLAHLSLYVVRKYFLDNVHSH